jgi:hypothetical protein
MAKFIDMTGWIMKEHGVPDSRLTVVRLAEKKSRTAAMWVCKCDCGNPDEIVIVGNSIRSGITKSCGCINKEVNSKNFFEDLTGKRFGDNITVIKRLPDKILPSGRRRVNWLCKSDGGEEFVMDPYQVKNAKHHAEKIYYIPEMYNFFKSYGMDDETMKRLTPSSNKKFIATCPDCGEKKEISPDYLFRQGFGCICKDNVSYLEKYVYKMLKSLHIQFNWQKIFDWSGKSRYDFYIDDLSLIIEPGGLQHTIGWRGDKNNADKNSKNDEIKKENALKNGIKHYVFFISTSHFSQIKKEILNAVDQNGVHLTDILGFKEEDVNWSACEEYALKNLVKESCILYKNGASLNDIASELNICLETVRQYVKNGTILGWCNYVPYKGLKVYQYNESGEINNVFPSLTNAEKLTGINRHKIKQCCLTGEILYVDSIGYTYKLA